MPDQTQTPHLAMLRWITLACALFALGAQIPAVEESKAVPPVAPLESQTLDGIRPFSRVGNIFLGGQPTELALETLKARGVTTVLDLRMPTEQRGFDEPAAVKRVGMKYVHLGVRDSASMTDAVFQGARDLMTAARKPKAGALLVHCASSNRVGAVWLASRVLDENVEWESALKQARSAGLRSPGLVLAAQEYVLGAGRRELGRYKLEIRTKVPKVKGMSVRQLSKRMGTATEPFLLDVRGAEEFAVSHLLGARRAVALGEALRVLGDRPKDSEIVLYCSIGYRSAYLAEKLQSAGYSRVRNLEGSIFEWANTGHPVFRDKKSVGEVHPYDKQWGRLLNRELWSGLK